MQQPITTRTGTTDAFLVEQGKLHTNDIKLYIAGSHSTSGAGIRIGLGSPPINDYRIIEDGVESWSQMGGIIYKKLFLRALTGSPAKLLGE